MIVLPPDIEQDIETLKRLSAQGRIWAESMNPTARQWRIARKGYAPCFISLTTGAVTQHGKVTKARGLSEALALVGVVI